MSRDETVLIIVPNAELRRSVAFLLESEGYAVAMHPGIPALDRPAEPRGSCAIVDDAALVNEPDVWSRLGVVAESFVMLLDGTRVPPLSLPVFGVDKPLLGLSLVEAVRSAIQSVAGPPT